MGLSLSSLSLYLSLSLSFSLSLSLSDHHLQLFPSSSTNTCITHTSLEGHSKRRELDFIASISTKLKDELTNLFRKKIKKLKYVTQHFFILNVKQEIVKIDEEDLPV